MIDSHEARLCRLEGALGKMDPCPEDTCPYWDRDAPLGGRCAVEELDLAGRPELAEWLLRIRALLEAAEAHDAEDEGHRDLYRLLETGDADGG